MYDPDEDARLINDLKDLINEKWNTFAESESFYSKDYNVMDDSYITDLGLPIHIGKLDKNEKKRLELNKYKNIDVKSRKIGNSKTKTTTLNNNWIDTDSDDEDDEGRIYKMLKATRN